MYSNTEWTNNEASRSKLALAELGYMRDDYVRHFTHQSLKRTPEINRGYYSRVYSVAHLVTRFLSAGGATAQVVNIGSGFDTLFWRLIDNPDTPPFARYVDVDHIEIQEHKIKVIKENPELLRPVGKIEEFGLNDLHGDKYHAISQDATHGRQLFDKLTKKCGIKPEDPVLFIFECVLLYWHEESCTTLLHSLGKLFPNCNFVVFDLVNTDDKFAHVMQDALAEHNTPLLGAESVKRLEDWNERFTKSGFKFDKSWMMTEVYDRLFPIEEKQRIEKLEFLDEKELLTQLFQHYCLVTASNKQILDW